MQLGACTYQWSGGRCWSCCDRCAFTGRDQECGLKLTLTLLLPEPTIHNSWVAEIFK